MIGIGINENVYFAGVDQSDKGAIVISFKQVGDAQRSIVDLLDSDEVEDIQTGKDIMLFPFNVPSFDDKSDRAKFDMVVAEIKDTKNLFVHLLSPFLTTDEIRFELYAGTGINNTISHEDLQRKLLSQPVLDQIWKNLSKKFIQLLKPLCNRPDLSFRLKLRRQSKIKHYPTLPKKYLTTEPCIEPMSVSAELSKVKFSAYEIKEGLDKADVLTPSDAADALPGGTDENLDNVFEPDASMFSENQEQL